MSVVAMFRQLSDPTVADFSRQLGQRPLKCFDLEPTSYALECALVKRENVMAKVNFSLNG
jgi:hypothetical protein